ncbi:MAG TPA: hypothetical protein VM142_04070 [Acidimicrobiales bacterium]|nr:hypothetical protein [Acidimicrobiales bacterium]
MTQVMRMFQTAIDPVDVDALRRLFSEDVLPVYTQLPGCLGMELFISVQSSAGGLVEGAAVSRWSNLEEMEKAIGSRPVAEAQVRILQLLRQEPVIRVFEVLA